MLKPESSADVPEVVDCHFEFAAANEKSQNG